MTPDYSIAQWMRKKLCIATRSPTYHASRYTCTYTTENNTPILICLSRRSLQRGTRTLLATIKPRHETTEATIQLLRNMGQKIIGILSIYPEYPTDTVKMINIHENLHQQTQQ